MSYHAKGVFPTRRPKSPILPLQYRDRCVYCGDPANTQDHYRCWSISRDPSTLPSCSECNLLLGDRIFETLGDRFRWLSRRLRARYKKLLRSDWEHLARGTTGRLLEALKGQMAKADYIESRLDWMETVGPAFDDLSCHLVAEEESQHQTLSTILRPMFQGEAFYEDDE
jgi:hypothetical protein